MYLPTYGLWRDQRSLEGLHMMWKESPFATSTVNVRKSVRHMITVNIIGSFIRTAFSFVNCSTNTILGNSLCAGKSSHRGSSVGVNIGSGGWFSFMGGRDMALHITKHDHFILKPNNFNTLVFSGYIHKCKATAAAMIILSFWTKCRGSHKSCHCTNIFRQKNEISTTTSM